MNKDFRHSRVNLSRVETWSQEVRRRIGKAMRRAAHRCDRRNAKREIMEAL